METEANPPERLTALHRVLTQYLEGYEVVYSREEMLPPSPQAVNITASGGRVTVEYASLTPAVSESEARLVIQALETRGLVEIPSGAETSVWVALDKAFRRGRLEWLELDIKIYATIDRRTYNPLILHRREKQVESHSQVLVVLGEVVRGLETLLDARPTYIELVRNGYRMEYAGAGKVIVKGYGLGRLRSLLETRFTSPSLKNLLKTLYSIQGVATYLYPKPYVGEEPRIDIYFPAELGGAVKRAVEEAGHRYEEGMTKRGDPVIHVYIQSP